MKRTQQEASEQKPAWALVMLRRREREKERVREGGREQRGGAGRETPIAGAALRTGKGVCVPGARAEAAKP
eukprot:738350-Rhodomonas_salina.1